MIDSTRVPEKGTLKYKFNKWFVNNINWCDGYKYDEYDEAGNPVEKSENKIYNFFYTYWLWPYIQTGCACCNTVRGLIYGGIIGFIVGKFIC